MMTSGLRSDAVGNDSTDRDRSAASPRTPGPHIAAAAAIDEILASEARANRQRSRASIVEEPVKAKPRITVPPARIVARPLHSPAWKAPFFSLAIVVGLSTLVSAGAIAYLLLRPIGASSAFSDADIRGLRDSVTQLRRQVADITGDMATHRAAFEAARAQAAEQASRAQNRVEREQVVPAAASSRVADDKPQVAQVAQVAPESSPDITGAVQPRRPANASRDVISGWHVRRAYDGVAVLEGKSGVVEVVPGQDIPAIGRIQEIKNENNRWQVLTSRGVILSGR